MTYACVVPYVHKPYFEEFIKTVNIPEDNMLFVDNTVDNIGIMRSHNKGVEFMRQRGADWLIVMSASIRFGNKGGLDFLEALEETDGLLLHGAGLWKKDPDQRIMALGWHLTAFRKEIFDNVGVWDENFSNYSLDDVDLTIRIQKHYGIDYKNRKVEIDMVHESTAHSIELAHIKGSAYAPRAAYFKRKWGKEGGEWKLSGYDHPFDNKANSLSYWPERDNPLSIHNVEFASGQWDFNDSY